MQNDATKWAVFTLHERLPPLAEQIAAARAWGLIGPRAFRADDRHIFVDDVTGQNTTNWPGKLKSRERLFEAIRKSDESGHVVWFRSPLCVGFTEHHARQTVQALFDMDAMILVSTIGMMFHKDDILDVLFERVKQERTASHARMQRLKKSHLSDGSEK